MSFADYRAAEVLAAGHRLRSLVRRTRLVLSQELSEIAGGDVWLKLENEQTTGSFKLRGALNAIGTLAPDVRTRGVVASSAGNHGLGVAYAARHYGIPATIFVPRTAPAVKRDGIAALGASVIADAPHYDAAHEAAVAFAEAHGAAFVNPCAGEMLLAGQGTVALEILEELPDLGTLVLPVGGGGLLGGCASLVRRVAPRARIVGAQSEHTDAMARSVAARRVVEIGYEATLADGLAGQIDEGGLEIGLHALDDIVTVTEDAIARAIVTLRREGRGAVEGSGAVGVAALRAGTLRSLVPPMVIVITGGNIDTMRLAELEARYD